jgi:hypothetical protein
MAGELGIVELFRRANESCLFTWKLLDLFLLEINAGWDGRLQMLVGAILHVGAVVVLLRALLRGSGDGERLRCYALAVWLVAMPIAWQNTLWGLQSIVYLAFLLQAGALVLLIRSRPLSGPWLMALSLLLLAYLSFASGFLAALAAAVIMLMRIDLEPERQKGAWLGVGILIAFAAICYLLIPQIEEHARFRARDLGDFFTAFLNSLAWPFIIWPWMALLAWLPFGWFLLRFINHPQERKQQAWMLLAFAAWIGIKAASTAYSRGAGGTGPSGRYMDLLCMAVLVNFLALGHLRAHVLVRGLWLGLMLGGTIWLNGLFALALDERVASMREMQRNVGLYLQTGDEGALGEDAELPFHSPDLLKRALDDEGIREVLPPRLVGGEEAVDERRLTPISEWLLAYWFLFAGAGGLLLLLGLLRLLRG